MTALGRVLAEAIVIEYGRAELLARLAHPFWFQSLGAVMGMDWHSSGITTSVLGALKRGLRPIEDEIGIYVCGGRGKHSRETPAELNSVGERTGLNGAELATTSRLVAKIDSACVQDGFDLYLHGLFVSKDGDWTVVQQGMKPEAKLARRYHWLSASVKSFVDEPHAAIEGRTVGEIVNLVDTRAADSRSAQLSLIAEGPDRVIAALQKRRPEAQLSLALPDRHHVTKTDVNMRRVHAALAAAHERGPVDFVELLKTPGVGARTLFSLALAAEVVHGKPHRFSDPARFSLAHGGKDGHPFPVPLKVYDRTIRVMKKAVDTAKLGQREKLDALKRLDNEARRIDETALAMEGPSFDELVNRERASSSSYGGRTVG